MSENRNQNQIIRKDARNCFVESLSDAFEIGRIHLAFATYDLSKPAGQRQTNNIHIYIAVDEDYLWGAAVYAAEQKEKRGQIPIVSVSWRNFC